MSRTVNSERLFKESDKERLRDLIWKVAEFCGVEVLTYTILSNHFHVLIRVPERTLVPPEEVFRRYNLLYPKPSALRPEQLEVLKNEVARGSDAGERWLAKQRRQMGEVSAYMKLLKQRFTVLFNRVHRRHGTLWSERFTSVLVEEGHATRFVAAYIDLNAFRAFLVKDPKDYRFCGHAEAVAGNKRAQQGCLTVWQHDSWKETCAAYRLYCFEEATKAREKGQVLTLENFRKVMDAGGQIAPADLLQCCLRYVTRGGVLGTPEFVDAEMVIQKERHGRVRELEPKMLPAIAHSGRMAVLRRPRRPSVFLPSPVA